MSDPGAAPAKISRTGVALRILIFALLELVGMIVFARLLYPLAGYMVAATLGTFAAAAVANGIAVRIWERARLADIGLGCDRGAMRNLGIGLAAGIGAGGVVIALPLAVGAASLKAVPESPFNLGSLLFVLILLVFGAVGEEMLFRGYGFQVLIPLLGQYAALLPMAVLFAAAHSNNVNVSHLGLVNTFGWGALLGWAFLRAGDLWLPVGLHLGWNWTLPLFGVNLSGFTMVLTGYTLEWKAGALWSGGDYGPEAGLLTTAVIPLLFYALIRAPVARHKPFLLRFMEDD